MPEHVYQSATDYGVVKCWHLHDRHTDQFTVTRGKLQVTLVDIRPDLADLWARQPDLPRRAAAQADQDPANGDARLEGAQRASR